MPHHTDDRATEDRATEDRTTEDRTTADRAAADRAGEAALACVQAGVDAADPERAVREGLRIEDGTLHVGDGSSGRDAHSVGLDTFDRVLVVGGGKAAAAVVRGLDAVLDDRIDAGCVVTDGDTDTGAGAGPVAALVADHPVPSARGVAATERVLELLEDADDRTLVLAPVTGGASALMVAPAEDIPLADLRGVTESLLASGAAIDEVNAVRKHCSRVKGGRLARLARPATVLCLLVSDVVGDDPAVIASGPFAPDPSTYDDALDVLERYGVDAPESIRERLAAGAVGEREETPKPGDDAFDRVTTHLLVTNRTALDAAAEVADERGLEPVVLSASMRGEARECALAHVAVVEEVLASGRPVEPPAVLLSGGEVTVTVGGDGSGGPNQEFALRAALDLPPGVACCSVDTDGRDGGTDAAGALVDHLTVEPGDGSVRDAAWRALKDNDSYSFLADRDALVRIDSTTNVNDLHAFVVPAIEGDTESESDAKR